MRIVRSARNAVLMSLILCVLLPQAALALTGDEIASPFSTVICALYAAFGYAIPALGVMIFVVAGALWVYSQDDAGKRNAAKVWITHVIIGAIIAVVAWVVAASIVPTGWVLYTCT
jgi:uncharacterized membrane protein